jgi:hypothetical protein
MPNMETELKSFAQIKLTQNEIMKNTADPTKSGERQDKNFRMVIEKTGNGFILNGFTVNG